MTVSDEAYAAILGATAQIEWSVLEPHFARGDLLAVAPQLDLVAVAAAMMEDNSELIKGWMDAGQLQVASDAQAADCQPALSSVGRRPELLLEALLSVSCVYRPL